MISLEAKLAKNIELMTESQRSKFNQKSKGMRGSVEPQVHLSEQILQESARGIRRNNGAAGYEERDAVAEADAVLFSEMAKCRPQSAVNVGVIKEQTDAYAALAESERGDYQFMKLAGLSHDEAMRVLKAGGIRG